MNSEHPMRNGAPPAWASGYGVDEYGPFATFSVGHATQTMRWVRPGTFLMGDEDRTQKTIEFEHGYWMADSPVTQALWAAVMGANPSHFASPTRPVEQVSWDDAQTFIEKLNGPVDGLRVQLPSEAQWECACRAGTTTATYNGPLEVMGAHNAPVLDDIAWYGGNSGVDFELARGSDSTRWSEKQYPHTKAGTHPVRLKTPNSLGLYDTLGNVSEWCADNYDTAGQHRVIRGGSWVDFARVVRAASRYRNVPGYRNVYLGFRLSSGPPPSGRSPSVLAPRSGSAGGQRRSAGRRPQTVAQPGGKADGPRDLESTEISEGADD